MVVWLFILIAYYLINSILFDANGSKKKSEAAWKCG